jgi:hypothetical protein
MVFLRILFQAQPVKSIGGGCCLACPCAGGIIAWRPESGVRFDGKFLVLCS